MYHLPEFESDPVQFRCWYHLHIPVHPLQMFFPGLLYQYDPAHWFRRNRIASDPQVPRSVWFHLAEIHRSRPDLRDNFRVPQY